MFSENDLAQLMDKGIELQSVERQLNQFACGFPPVKLADAATIENCGIIKISEEKTEQLLNFYGRAKLSKSIMKFVPASGAASRMFKSLFAVREEYGRKHPLPIDWHNDKRFSSLTEFLYKIKNFAFYDDLVKVMKKGGFDLNKCLADGDWITIIDCLLDESGLNYAALPKGLLKFHKYPEGSRTAFEEHLVEAALYCSVSGLCRIHFTISPEHIRQFLDLLHKVKGQYESLYSVRYDVSYSVQKTSTDTIAVDLNNKPFREANGTLVFRPGGHGALLENLNDLDSDIIFVKNIDNIVPDRLKNTTVLFKKILSAYLFEMQEQIFSYLRMLDSDAVSDEVIEKIFLFAEKSLNISMKGGSVSGREEKIGFLKRKLNRPLRVCGMVKNEGEPGGGPFWVKDKQGEISLQIVESSQVNLDDARQKELFNNSTHFNPVDLVCGVKNYKGEKFNLLDFVNPETGFISVKSKDGRELKALELPGLWNGAMADWITLFVEVPLITFNPVKTVNDLLREEHQ